MTETVWKTGPATIRCGESVLVGRITVTDALSDDDRFGFSMDGIRDYRVLNKADWTPEYPKRSLPTEPGSVIMNATIRGEEGHMAVLQDRGEWVSVDSALGYYAHRERHITGFTVAKVVPADAEDTSSVTIAQIAEEAARHVCQRNGLKKYGSRDWVTALAWGLGVGIEYEHAIRELVSAAIKIEKENDANN